MITKLINRTNIQQSVLLGGARWTQGLRARTFADMSNKNSELKIQYEKAELGKNATPKDFSVEEIMQTVDPKTMVKKEPSYEYRDLPEDGKEKNEYHPMHSLEEFPNSQNDISKEYGFKVKGLEPTRFNDWERRGRCTDF